MTDYIIDTNAGPIIRRRARDAREMRRYVEASVPMLRRRGYTSVWSRSRAWHVLTVFNSRGRNVHACAFRPEGRS